MAGVQNFALETAFVIVSTVGASELGGPKTPMRASPQTTTQVEAASEEWKGSGGGMHPDAAMTREKTIVSPAKGAIIESGKILSTITSTTVASTPSMKKPAIHFGEAHWCF